LAWLPRHPTERILLCPATPLTVTPATRFSRHQPHGRPRLSGKGLIGLPASSTALPYQYSTGLPYFTTPSTLQGRTQNPPLLQFNVIHPLQSHPPPLLHHHPKPAPDILLPAMVAGQAVSYLPRPRDRTMEGEWATTIPVRVRCGARTVGI
jgi:hypothetical protein